MTITTVTGVLHGRTIELDQAFGVADGQRVEVVIRTAAPKTGDGIRASAGGWADADDEEFDLWLKETYEARSSHRDVSKIAGTSHTDQPCVSRGDFVELDGLLGVVVGVEGEASVPDDHLAVWFGTPQTTRISEGGTGRHRPEVWTAPKNDFSPAAAPIYRH